MNPEAAVVPREALKAQLERYGSDLANQPARLGGLLRDVCGQYRLEISLIVGAAEDGVPADLLTGSQGAFPEARVAQLARRLESTRGLSPESARWAVESWAFALGIDRDVPRAEDTTSEMDRQSTDRIISPAPPAGPMGNGDAKAVETDPSGGRKPRAAIVVGVVLALLLGASGAGLWILAREGASTPNGGTDTGPLGTTPTGPSGTIGPSVPPPEPPLNAPIKLRDTELSWDAVTLSWGSAPFGQRAEKYRVYRNGEPYRTVTSKMFVDSGVVFGTHYVYRVRAIADGEESKATQPLAVDVPLPPVSEARFEGSYGVTVRVTSYTGACDDCAGYSHFDTWHFDPQCGVGPCGVTMTSNRFGWSASLGRDGGSYRGTASGVFFRSFCGSGRASSNVTISLSLTNATARDGIWSATSFGGSVVEVAFVNCPPTTAIYYSVSL